jgi:hypothetical protein
VHPPASTRAGSPARRRSLTVAARRGGSWSACRLERWNGYPAVAFVHSERPAAIGLVTRLSSMQTEEIALIVAISSAAFSGGALVWQLFLYRLSGSRLLVRLTPALVDSNGTLVRGPDKGFGNKQPSRIMDALMPWGSGHG